MTSAERLNNDRVVMWFDDFDGEHPHRFLSNFYEGAPIECGSVTADTGEHLYAAFKAATAEDFDLVLSARGPGEAKAIGRAIPLRPDWEETKYDAMRLVLQAKFWPGRDEADRLLATGDKLLVEGTYWDDRVWGVDLMDEQLPGRNWLGTLLMARRAELRAGVTSGPSPYLMDWVTFGTEVYTGLDM